MPDFECHITCPLDQAEDAAKVAEMLHWSTSEIERDPVLGKASYFYLTSHAKDFQTIYANMLVATSALRHARVPVIREKIELIIHDVRHTEGNDHA